MAWISLIVLVFIPRTMLLVMKVFLAVWLVINFHFGSEYAHAGKAHKTKEVSCPGPEEDSGDQSER